MKRLTLTGILVLIFGIIAYLILVDEISGIYQAIVIGLLIGSVLALREEFGKD